MQTSGSIFRSSSMCSNICNLQYKRTGEDFCEQIVFEFDVPKHMKFTIQTHRWRLLETDFVWARRAQSYVIYNTNAPMKTSGNRCRLSSTRSIICNLQYKLADEDLWKHILLEFDVLKHMQFTIQTHRWRLLEAPFVWARHAQTYGIYNTNAPMETPGTTFCLSSTCSNICNWQHRRTDEDFWNHI